MLKYFALALIFIVLGCNQSTENQDETPLNISMNIQNLNFGRCDTLLGRGVELSVKYSEPSGEDIVLTKIKNNLYAKVLERINADLDSSAIEENPEVKINLNAAYTQFETGYKNVISEFPDAPGCWEINIQGDSVMTTSKYFFYKFQQYAYTGGAHPNSFTSYHAYDLKTGEEVDQKMFISDSITLLKKVEVGFRKEQQLTANADLEKEGYFLDEGKFFLPHNYVFVKEGLRFYYNAYEIAPYVYGAIEFTIPYADLADCVKIDQVF